MRPSELVAALATEESELKGGPSIESESLQEALLISASASGTTAAGGGGGTAQAKPPGEVLLRMVRGQEDQHNEKPLTTRPREEDKSEMYACR